MIFFSKNKRTAIARVRKLARRDRYYVGKTVRLARKQLPHISGWKTWKLVETRRKT